MVQVLAGTETGYRGDSCRFICAVAYMYYIFTCVWNMYWGHLPGHPGYFFWVFRTSLEHVLHFFILVTYLFKTFTHQIISVHPEDAPEIPHFSRDKILQKFRIFPRTITQTPGCFFCGFSAHSRDMCCIFTCVWHIYSRHLPRKLLVYILKMLRKFRTFPGTITRTPGCFFRVFRTSLRHVDVQKTWIKQPRRPGNCPGKNAKCPEHLQDVHK